jgi:hypothetical protein
MQRPLGAVVASVFALLGSGCEFSLCVDELAGTDVVATDQERIIGGVVDEVNASTLALFLTTEEGNRALCSASAIRRRGKVVYALTAAHCAQGTVDDVISRVDLDACLSDSTSPQCSLRYQPIDWFNHPDYNDSTLFHDVAVVRFRLSDGVPPPPLVPAALSADGLVAGDELELSGFGQIEAGPSGSVPFQTKRHHVFVPVETVFTSTLRVNATAGETACFGDSGGPAYAWIGGVRKVVGVASSADFECKLFSNYARTSAEASFISSVLEAPCAECEPDAGAGGGNEGGGPGAGGASEGGGPGAGGASEGGSAQGGAPGEGAGSAQGGASEGAGSSQGGAASAVGGSGEGEGAAQGGAAQGAASGAGAEDVAAGGGNSEASGSNGATDPCTPVTLSCDLATMGSRDRTALGWAALIVALMLILRGKSQGRFDDG